MATYAQLKEIVAATEAEADKFYNKGNKAAGTRLRKGLQAIRKVAQELRQEVVAAKSIHRPTAK